LKVSRPDVPSDVLLDYGEDQFLIADLSVVYELEGFEMIAPQIALANAVNNPKYRFITGCLSRRTGKTNCANRIAFCKILEPERAVLVVAPNFSLASISWEEQHHLIELAGLKSDIKKSNTKDREIFFKNGSFIKLASASRINSAVGRSYDLILGDEFALDNSLGDGFEIQLRPTLDKPNSKAIFISTPRGDNHFKRFYDYGYDIDPDNMGRNFPQWVSIHSTYEDNPRAAESDIEDARRVMSTAKFAQEYEADFVTFEGQIYGHFDDDNLITRADFNDMYYDADFEHIMGIDHGYRDPTSAVLLVYDEDRQIYYLCNEYEEAEGTTTAHAAAFRNCIHEINGEDEPDIAYCDSAAAQFRADLAYEHEFSTTKANKSKLDGIAYIADLVARKKLIIVDDCDKSVLSMRNYRWDDKEGLAVERPKHDEWCHLADAIRYAVYSHQGV